MTPAHCWLWGNSDKYPSKDAIKKFDALPLQGYVDIIKKSGEKHNIPVIDLFENLGLDPNDEAIRNEYTADGLHFNDKGQYLGIVDPRTASSLFDKKEAVGVYLNDEFNMSTSGNYIGGKS